MLNIDNPWLEVAKKKNPPYIASCDMDMRLVDFYNLRLEILPVPYIGNLDKAKVVVLLLNPGYTHSEDDIELKSPELQEALRDNLDPAKSRLFQLEDEFEWTAGGKWLRDRFLKPLAKAGLSIDDLMEKIMVVEYFPYHSQSFNKKFRGPIPSQKYGFELVKEAIKRGKTIIVMRSANLWYKAVPELAEYEKLAPEKCIALTNRAAYLSEANLGKKNFAKVASLLAQK